MARILGHFCPKALLGNTKFTFKPSTTWISNRNYSTQVQPPRSKIQYCKDNEHKEIINEFPAVLQDIKNIEGIECMTESYERIVRMLEYNSFHGKFIRASLAIKIARGIKESQNGPDLPNLIKITWAYELIHTFGYILDDLVDGSLIRKNRPCWYLVDNLGLAAANDAILIENLAYVLFHKYVDGQYPLSLRIHNLIRNTIFLGIIGQSLDLTNSHNKQYDMYTPSTYKRIAGYKNGLYTFHAPICLGLLLNGVDNPQIIQQVKNISLDMGLFFSIHDDFADCFGNPEKSGKIGTDIQDGWCSWLISNALQLVNESQRKILLDNFGQNDPEKIRIVKSIYEDVGLKELYVKHLNELYGKIQIQIQNLPQVVPKEPLRDMINFLLERAL